MNKYFLSLIVIGTILWSCNSKSGEQLTLESIPVNSAYDTLQKIELPFKLTTHNWRPYIKYYYKKLGQNSIPSNYPVGIISQNDKFKAVLIIIDELPVLMTFDNNQNPINTLFILDDYGMNPSKDITEFSAINKDLRVILIDSMYTYDLDENEIQISGTQRFQRTEDHYKISNKGIIEKIE